MPIKQLDTDRYAFPEAGRVRLGRKDPAKGNPIEADHFVLDDAPDLIPHYGKIPRSLLIYFPYRETDENFHAWMECYGRSGCICRGDGDRILRYIDPKPGGAAVLVREGVVIEDYHDMAAGVERDFVKGEIAPCPGPDRNLYARCERCSPTGRLFFMVRDPAHPSQLVNGRFATYMLTTRSFRNIRRATEFFNTLQLVANALGKSIVSGIANIPVIMRRYKAATQVMTASGAMQIDKWFVDFEIDPAFEGQAAQAIAAQSKQLMLKAGARHPDDQIDLIVLDDAQEFSQLTADLGAMADTLPPRLADARAILKEMAVAYGINAEEWETRGEAWLWGEVRHVLGVAPETRLPYNAATWSSICNVMAKLVKGEVTFSPEGVYDEKQ